MAHKNPSWPDLVRRLVLPTILGFMAGIVGGLAAFSQYLTAGVETPVPQVRHPVQAVTAPLPDADIADRLDGLDLLVYPKKAIRTGDQAEKAILPGEAAGLATVLTSDGWLLTHQSVVKGEVAVAVGGKLLIPKTVIVDPMTGAAFLKVDSGPLQVSNFEETDLMRPGAPLYSQDAERQFAKNVFTGTSLADRKDRERALEDSDAYGRLYRLQRGLSAKAVGGAVLTAGGNLAGVVAPSIAGDGGSFIPMHLLDQVLSDVFAGHAPRRASLGVNYIDLNGSLGADLPAEAPRGALVSGSQKWGIPAVVPGGAAAGAGLAAGDIITRVDDTDISGGRDLGEVIGDYRPGTEVKIEAWRAGSRQTFDVTLH